jgi:hypothetical protein
MSACAVPAALRLPAAAALSSRAASGRTLTVRSVATPRRAVAAAPRRAAARHAAAPRATPHHPTRRGPAPAGAFFKDLQKAFGGGGGSDDAAPSPPAPAKAALTEEEAAAALGLAPPYSVVRRTEAYELRVYGSYTAATTPYVQRPDGLQRLAEYCDGANADAAPLAATQPLTMRYDPAPGVRRGAAAAPQLKLRLRALLASRTQRVSCVH